MKVKEFFAELVWDKDEEDWILSRGLDDIINEWLENNNVNIIDVNYNSVVIGSKNNCIQSTALLFYKEKTTQTITTAGGNDRGVVLEKKWAYLD